MLAEYINNNYQNGEPIFIDEIKYKNKNALSQELKRLTDNGFLSRVYNGVYYKNYSTVLNTEGKMSIDLFIKKRFLFKENKTIGYLTGLSLANKYGFTTQVPAVFEICTNEATTKQRKIIVDGFNFIIYSPTIPITNDNVSALQFLDLMLIVDKYGELMGKEMRKKIDEFITKTNVNFKVVKKILKFYPDRVYRNLYQAGLINELL